MKNIYTGSNKNALGFCKGDYVFEVTEGTKADAPVGQAVMHTFNEVFKSSNGQIGWEVCCEQDYTIKGFAIHTTNKAINMVKIVNTIKNGLNDLIVNKETNKAYIQDVYHLI